ncbi:hypothetical protein PV10_04612 [Exophiala mesophila]|uniref:Uncharacterized protein n=1 Tax=Exophiala mesophila TaxID=212818 RepID=A0A0D1ZHT0_EXOME|nr:uncharacterized protein PV10_04612 [Exophiala mesophila]KIV93399.1 hypothetical protein PV10_04612 [Exophiala mesophila]
MPSEIADSDDEPEFNSPQKSDVNSMLDVQPPSVAPASSAIDFDQFLDTTQHLSSLPSPCGENAKYATSSTEKIINGIDIAHDVLNASSNQNSVPTWPGNSIDMMLNSPRSKSVKRARSTFVVSSATTDSALAKSARNKRTKTHGHQPSMDFEDERNQIMSSRVPEARKPTSANQSSNSSERGINGSLEIGPFQDSLYALNPAGISMQRPNSLQNMTSMASMGGYQSINLDYRGLVSGLDINTNPFGSVSQVSLDEDPNHAEGLHQSNQVFDPACNAQGEDSALESPKDGAPPIFHSSQDQQITVDPREVVKGDEALLNTENETSDTPTTANEISLPEPIIANDDNQQPKKRGRKPKGSRLSSKVTAPLHLDDEVDGLELPDLELIRSRRQGTVESVSAASHASSTGKQPKRQSKRVAEQMNSQSSPTKQPTSELHLSDEHVIGLPKESYKPRPTRSRAKKTQEETEEQDCLEMNNLNQMSTRKIDVQDDAQEGKLDLDGDAVPEPTPAKPSAKKGRKNKVKRAKTSAAALLKKAEPMLSEGEEDVVWMDTKPAPVKLDLPPDLKILKKDEIEEERKTDQLKGNQKKEHTSSDVAKFSILLPAAAAEDSIVPDLAAIALKAAPKKRGRKPRKAQPEPAEPKKAPLSDEVVVEDEEQDPEQRDNREDSDAVTTAKRPALRDISSNMPPTSSRRPSDVKAPTVSPLSSVEPEQQHDPGSRSINNINLSPTKPSPSSPTAQVTPVKTTAKGPTQHSPINPPTATSGRGPKVLYRVGLSRRQNIPSLLSRVQRDKEPPKIVVRKEKEKKKKEDNGSDDERPDPTTMRDGDGMLIEWGD